MKLYKIGQLIFEPYKNRIGRGYVVTYKCYKSHTELDEETLIEMGATPIDDKPGCACEKTSNEWKMYSLNSDGQCIHCGRQISPKPEGEYLFISRKGMAKLGVEPQGNGLISEKLGIKTKPEKIEPISYLEIHNKWSNDSELFMNKMNELIKAVNSLKGE